MVEESKRKKKRVRPWWWQAVDNKVTKKHNYISIFLFTVRWHWKIIMYLKFSFVKEVIVEKKMIGFVWKSHRKVGITSLQSRNFPLRVLGI